MDLYSYNIFAHFNRPEDPLMAAFKLFVDTFVSFQKRGVIIILLCNENIVVLDL